jgi:hypothetical protein
MSYRNNIITFEVTRGSNRQKYDGDAPLKILAMAEAGMFPEEWCVELGITIRTLYSWANERPEVEEAVEAAWHVLHAYYTRLVRQNLSNPSLRQTALLQVMAKRFPSTWGQAPINTLDHFLARNSPAPSAGASLEEMSPDAHRPKNREELLARIKVLMDRMADRNSDHLSELGYRRVDPPGEEKTVGGQDPSSRTNSKE